MRRLFSRASRSDTVVSPPPPGGGGGPPPPPPTASATATGAACGRAAIASGASGDPEGIATIQVGYDTLKLAETLKPLLEKQLL